MKQKEEKKKSIRKNNFFQNPDADNGSETGTSLGKFPHYIPNLKLYQWTLTLLLIADEHIANKQPLKVPKRNIRKSELLMEGDAKNKGSYDSLSFPIMGARGLMREEAEE